MGLEQQPGRIGQRVYTLLFLTFKSEEDRAIYLPHPDHKAFGQVLTPYLDDVLVVDYWTK